MPIIHYTTVYQNTMEYLANMLPSRSTSISMENALAQPDKCKRSDPYSGKKPTPARPRYLNTPNYPGTSVPRPDFTAKRRGSSPTLGKRLRQSKVFQSFPRIPDETPPSSPTESIKLTRRTVTPTERQLTKVLTASRSQVSLKSTLVPPALASPTTQRLVHFRSQPVDPGVKLEIVDVRPDLVPNSPTRYVYNSLETPPVTPATEQGEESFFSSLVSSGRRPSHHVNSDKTTCSSSGRQRKEKMVLEEDVIFRSTMSQKAANPYTKSGALEMSWRAPTAKAEARPSKLDHVETLTQAEEERLRRLQPEQYKIHVRAQTTAQWKAQNEALAAEKAALKAQGKMSLDELYANAPALLNARGWLFQPPPPPPSVADAGAQMDASTSLREKAAASMKEVLALRVGRKGGAWSVGDGISG